MRLDSVEKKNRDPSGVNVIESTTPPLATTGLKAVTVPLTALTSAAPGRAAPPIRLNPPTAYTLLPSGETPTPRTVQSGRGRNVVLTPPVVVSIATRRRLATPPISVNRPPAYSRLPLTASASTSPFAV